MQRLYIVLSISLLLCPNLSLKERYQLKPACQHEYTQTKMGQELDRVLALNLVGDRALDLVQDLVLRAKMVAKELVQDLVPGQESVPLG